MVKSVVKLELEVFNKDTNFKQTQCILRKLEVCISDFSDSDLDLYIDPKFTYQSYHFQCYKMTSHWLLSEK